VTFATAGPDATLADAKKAMERTANCQDVLITLDGTERSAVKGWLTNVIIGKAAQA
jgi:hypothetical protein